MSLPEIRTLRELGLSQLWQEAESLGSIEVRQHTWRERLYTVEITFNRSSGTRIHAIGKNQDICFALSDAINEAREMGAGGAA